MTNTEIITNMLTKVKIFEYLGEKSRFFVNFEKKIDIFFFKILKKCEIIENLSKIKIAEKLFPKSWFLKILTKIDIFDKLDQKWYFPNILTWLNIFKSFD